MAQTWQLVFTSGFLLAWVPALLVHLLLLFFLVVPNWRVSLHLDATTAALLFNLTLSDLLFLLSSSLFNFFYILLSSWPFGLFLCNLRFYLHAVVITMTPFTLVVLAFYYYRIIVRHKRTNLSKTKLTLILAITWFTILLIWSPFLNSHTIISFTMPQGIEAAAEDLELSELEHTQWSFHNETFTLLNASTIRLQKECLPRHDYDSHTTYILLPVLLISKILPISFLFVIYGCIGWTLYGPKDSGNSDTVTSETDAISPLDHQLVKMMFLTTLISFLLSLPHNSLVFIHSFSSSSFFISEYTAIILHLTSFLAFLGYYIKPFIYIATNEHFRATFRELLYTDAQVMPAIDALSIEDTDLVNNANSMSYAQLINRNGDN